MENKEVVLIVLGVAVVALILALTFGRTSSPTGAQSAEELQAYIEAYGIDACIEKYGDACTSSQPNEEVQGDTPWPEPTGPNAVDKKESNTCKGASSSEVTITRWAHVASDSSVSPNTPGSANGLNLVTVSTEDGKNGVIDKAKWEINWWSTEQTWAPSVIFFTLTPSIKNDHFWDGTQQVYSVSLTERGSKSATSYKPKNQPGCQGPADCEKPCTENFQPSVAALNGELLKLTQDKLNADWAIVASAVNSPSSVSDKIQGSPWITAACIGADGNAIV